MQRRLAWLEAPVEDELCTLARKNEILEKQVAHLSQALQEAKATNTHLEEMLTDTWTVQDRLREIAESLQGLWDLVKNFQNEKKSFTEEVCLY